MVELEPTGFFDLHERFSAIPHTQSEPWHRYLLAREERCVFLADDRESPQVAFLARVKRVPVLGEVLLVDGELRGDDATEEVVAEFYRDVAALPYAGIEINSVSPYSFDFEIGVRRAGFVRPLLATSSPLSYLIDLTQEPKYSRNWRYNYRRALKSELVFEAVPAPESSDLVRFCEMYRELMSRKELGKGLDPDSLGVLLDGTTMWLYFVRDPEGRILAGNIIYVDGARSYDIWAANSHESLTNGATRYIIQGILDDLRADGVESFDFGRLPPSADARDGVYVFKTSVSGSRIQYNGEWAFYRSPVREYLVHLGKRLARRTRY